MNLGKYIEKIESELKRWGLPSVAVGIVKGEEVILSDGFGYASTKDKRKPDGDTLYQIGSCSKAFTATALAILSDQGKLDFDKPAREYLPWLRFKDPYLTEHVTVRDLLCHRTGLPHGGGISVPVCLELPEFLLYCCRHDRRSSFRSKLGAVCPGADF